MKCCGVFQAWCRRFQDPVLLGYYIDKSWLGGHTMPPNYAFIQFLPKSNKCLPWIWQDTSLVHACWGWSSWSLLFFRLLCSLTNFKLNVALLCQISSCKFFSIVLFWPPAGIQWLLGIFSSRVQGCKLMKNIATTIYRLLSLNKSCLGFKFQLEKASVARLSLNMK